jgi:hypothetical protein
MAGTRYSLDLQPYHKKVARALALGHTEKEAAELVKDHGFTLKDVRRWRKLYDFRKWMQDFEKEFLDPTVMDFLSTLRRECYERLHDMLQSEDMDDWKWAISHLLKDNGGAGDATAQADRSVAIYNYVETPEAKEHGKRYLESLRKKPQPIASAEMAEA